MTIEFFIFDGIPEPQITDGVLDLYSATFESSAEEILAKMKTKPNLILNIAMDGNRVVGFKMGHELDGNKFYSWLGAVEPAYRQHRIASKLMEEQHGYLLTRGYEVVQTKTMNKWRGMLILNIKYGFDVIETYTDENGLHKIILEKSLRTS